jgi:hypothetical protein
MGASSRFGRPGRYFCWSGVSADCAAAAAPSTKIVAATAATFAHRVIGYAYRLERSSSIVR